MRNICVKHGIQLHGIQLLDGFNFFGFIPDVSDWYIHIHVGFDKQPKYTIQYKPVLNKRIMLYDKKEGPISEVNLVEFENVIKTSLRKIDQLKIQMERIKVQDALDTFEKKAKRK